MNSTWPFSFVDRNLVHIDKREKKKNKLNKIKQVRSFGVERSLKRACVGNEAAVSLMMAEAFSGGARPSPFCSKKRKKRILREKKIRIKT